MPQVQLGPITMGYSQRRTEQGYLAGVWILPSGTMLCSELLGWGQGHHSLDGTSITVLLVVHTRIPAL